MQIHELNNFTGTPTSSDYLAIDNSTITTKIGATGLGVQDKLTVAEANTGTSTSSRIVTPKVVHDYVTGVVDDIESSATETKWANITGGDGSIDDALDYTAGMLKTETITPDTTDSTGTLSNAQIYKYGKLIQLCVTVKNSSAIAAGSNIYSGSFSDSDYYPQYVQNFGYSFNGSHDIGMLVSNTGTITVRNMSGGNLTANTDVRSNIVYIIP